MPIYNYKKSQDGSLDKYPIHSHLLIETSVGLYFIDSVDRTKLYSMDVSDGTQVQVDVDPSNTSGDAKSRDRDVIAAWHDRSDEKIWFVDCDNPNSQFDVWYLDYSGGLGSETATEVDEETGFTTLYINDIFKIGSNFYVSCVDTDIPELYIYDVTVSPFSQVVSQSTITFGFFFGGAYAGSLSNVIDYINVSTTTGNAVDRGDLLAARRACGGVSGSVYGFFGGGDTGAIDNVIQYIDLSLTTGNAADKGDLTVARKGARGVNGSSYGFFGGGTTGSYVNVIDYIDITATTGNATDTGDLTVARGYSGGVQGSSYGFFGGGGISGDTTNVIDYIDITATTGNATDKGDLTLKRGVGGVSGPTYGYFGGDFLYVRNIIDYINITTTSGNATDKGDLSVSRTLVAGVNGDLYGYFGGGYTGYVYSNVIDYIDVTTTSGNATDKGDLTAGRTDLGGVNG